MLKLPEQNNNVKVSLYQYTMDITQYCSDKPKGVDKIFELFLFDPTRATYCCELTPSAEMNFVYTYYTDTDEELTETERETIHDYIMDIESDTESHMYVHMSRAKKEMKNPSVSNTSESYEECMEDTIEYLRCNPDH